jgi:DNA-binding NarL/FixJ family response regulator
VLIVDDHAAFREFICDLLSREGFEIAGRAGDGESAVEAVSRSRPDLVLLDVQLPGIDGFDVAQRLVELPHPPGIVMTSTRDARDYGARLIRAPVLGFISKQDLSGDAIAALHAEGCQSA